MIKTEIRPSRVTAAQLEKSDRVNDQLLTDLFAFMTSFGISESPEMVELRQQINSRMDAKDLKKLMREYKKQLVSQLPAHEQAMFPDMEILLAVAQATLFFIREDVNESLDSLETATAMIHDHHHHEASI